MCCSYLKVRDFVTWNEIKGRNLNEKFYFKLKIGGNLFKEKLNEKF